MKLDHATIVTPDLQATQRFFCAVVGLEDGPRPPFSVSGHWLYAQGQAVIHLIDATIGRPAGPSSPRLDHFALRVESAEEWVGLLARLQRYGIPYQYSEVPLADELQVFVALGPGVAVEFVIARQNLPH